MSAIVRVSTARVVPELLTAFTEYILAAVQEFPKENPGLLCGEEIYLLAPLWVRHYRVAATTA